MYAYERYILRTDALPSWIEQIICLKIEMKDVWKYLLKEMGLYLICFILFQSIYTGWRMEIWYGNHSDSSCLT